jgi:hypothetical protein
MKYIIIAAVAAGIASFGFIAGNKPAPESRKINVITGSYSPVAVLELFTSEGCSSCPPADNLLPQLIKMDPNIIALSFHVDYWNRLGWADPFSSSKYTDRQKEYSRQLNLESIYTPQLIVNGEYEFVGSDRRKAELAIKKILKEKTLIKLSVDNVRIADATLYFTVNAEGDYSKTNLLAAIVQKQVSMNVKAGENRGAKLSHTNVVRELTMQKTATRNEFALTIPNELTGNQWQLIVYAQQTDDLKITGAVLYNPDMK